MPRNEYRPLSSRPGFVARGLVIGAVAIAALITTMFFGGMFMHGDP